MHYKMTGAASKEVIHSELDIKNKVLIDKRKSMIKVLKDKRPMMALAEKAPKTLAYSNTVARGEMFLRNKTMFEKKSSKEQPRPMEGSMRFPSLRKLQTKLSSDSVFLQPRNNLQS
mmetsp:Transcript_47345/g.62639  ORF Transcript_47345/g.62639 Transcript_47345/m.62639 type:complete len:116 (-) Transcript_47345:443-790(-)